MKADMSILRRRDKAAAFGTSRDHSSLLAVVLFSGILLAMAFAQESSADTVPDAGAMRAAYDYLRATDAGNNIGHRIGRFRSDALRLFRARGLDQFAAAACVDSVLLPGFSARSDGLLQIWASILVSHLSADDLQSAARWERSPAAQHVHGSFAPIIDHTESVAGDGAQPGGLALQTVAPSDNDARDLVSFGRSPAGLQLNAELPLIAASWNAATITWELQTMESLVGQAAPAPCH